MDDKDFFNPLDDNSSLEDLLNETHPIKKDEPFAGKKAEEDPFANGSEDDPFAEQDQDDPFATSEEDDPFAGKTPEPSMEDDPAIDEEEPAVDEEPVIDLSEEDEEDPFAEPTQPEPGDEVEQPADEVAEPVSEPQPPVEAVVNKEEPAETKTASVEDTAPATPAAEKPVEPVQQPAAVQPPAADAASLALLEMMQGMQETMNRMNQRLDAVESGGAAAPVDDRALPAAKSDAERMADEEQFRLRQEEESRLRQAERQEQSEAALENLKAQQAEQEEQTQEQQAAAAKAKQEAAAVAERERLAAEQELNRQLEEEQQRQAERQRLVEQERLRQEALRQQREEEQLRLEVEAAAAAAAAKEQAARAQAQEAERQRLESERQVASDNLPVRRGPAPIENDNPYAQLEDKQTGFGDALTPNEPVQARENELEPAVNRGGSVLYSEPIDVLLAIARIDKDLEEERKASQVVNQVRQQASAEGSSRRGGRGNRQTIKMPSLPFEQLVQGTPLVIANYSPAGGTGKSSQSMNLAVMIAAVADTIAKKRMAKGEQNIRTPKILLIDGDVVTGSLAIRLSGDVTPNMHDLVMYLLDRQEEGHVGRDRWPSRYYTDEAPPGTKAMQDFIMSPPSLPNLNLLAAPDVPDKFFDFDDEDYREMLQMLGQFYDVIVIDCGTEVVMKSNRSWLAHSNEVFMMTTPDLDRLYNTGKIARLIGRPGPEPDDPYGPEKPALVPLDKMSVVMTSFDAPDVGMDVKASFEKMFPWLDESQKFWVSDFSLEMRRANNQSRFLVTENPKYAKQVSLIAERAFARYASQRNSLPSGR